MRKKLGNHDKHISQSTSSSVGPKYLLRGDANARLSIWNLNSLNQSSISFFFVPRLLDFNLKKLILTFKYLDESLKYSNYETSLSKFWKENFKLDNENVRFLIIIQRHL
jgi:hypothetical protein